MTWGINPRRKSFLGGLVKLNVSPKRIWRERHDGLWSALKQGSSVTGDTGFVSLNSRTRRPRWRFPFGIYKLGRRVGK